MDFLATLWTSPSASCAVVCPARMHSSASEESLNLMQTIPWIRGPLVPALLVPSLTNGSNAIYINLPGKE